MEGNIGFVEDINKLQVIKCVVVGDKGVGKSHLVCAKACGTRYTLHELCQTHVSTVWAVDTYRTNHDVQRRSICTVECVTCSLRIWDTFGGHDKDRQFAYKECACADVILVCFSIANRRSLKHIETHWLPEIRRHCEYAPIVICACQIDMRYLYKDSSYIEHEKDSFFKPIKTNEIVFPAEGKEIAKKLGGAYYYETSVHVQYGIDEVFTNCIRAALIMKRRGLLLVAFGNLKNVVKPHLQVPHMPPRPSPPKVVPYENRKSLTMMPFEDLDLFSDVVFVVRKQMLKAHLVYLIAASPSFQSFFEEKFGIIIGTNDDNERLKNVSFDYALNSSRSPSQMALVDESFDAVEGERRDFNEINFLRRSMMMMMRTKTTDDVISDVDTGVGGSSSIVCSSQCLSNNDDTKLNIPSSTFQRTSGRHRSVSARQYRMSSQYLPSSLFSSGSTSVSTGLLLDYDDDDDEMKRTSSSNVERDSGYTPTNSSSFMSSLLSFQGSQRNDDEDQVIITVDESVNQTHFQMVIDFLYTGDLPLDLSPDVLNHLKVIAQMLRLDQLDLQIDNILNGEAFLNFELKKRFQKKKNERIQKFFLDQDYLSDVTIHLDDGIVLGHRCLLSGRCDMMLKMFASNFSERSTKIVTFPGVSKDAFLGIQEYLYTGQCPSTCKDWIGLIELANRLFLKDLLLSSEIMIIKELAAAMESGCEVVESALAMLSVARLHGASQLAEWCTWCLKVNYKEIIENNSKALDVFDSELRANIAAERWPPEWYLQEMKIYEKAMLEMNKEKPEQSWLRRSNGGEACIGPSGCFMPFWKRRNRTKIDSIF